MSKRCGTIAILGMPNVGKSTLLNALLGQKIAPTSPKPQTTRLALRGIVLHGDSQMIFVDTPGLLPATGELHRFMRRQALSSLEGIDVLVWVCDRVSDDLSELTRLNMPFILVFNKIDRLADKAELLPSMTRWSKLKGFLGVIPVSAKMQEGLEELKTEIAKYLPEREWEFGEDIVTTNSERELVAELIREKVLLQLDKEIPHQIAVTIENFDEKRREDKKKPIVEISAVLNVERESQKRIVVGHAGERIKQIGISARKDVEALLGCQVMLKLFVRIEPNWSQSSKGLSKVGF